MSGKRKGEDGSEGEGEDVKEGRNMVILTCSSNLQACLVSAGSLLHHNI